MRPEYVVEFDIITYRIWLLITGW